MQFIDDNTEDVLKADGFLAISSAQLAKILKRRQLNAAERLIFERAVGWAEAKLQRCAWSLHVHV